MSETQSPLSRLVVFMVCLSIAGAFVAGIHYYAVDLPRQQTLQVPENSDCCNEGSCLLRIEACQKACSTGSCLLNCYQTYHDGGATC